jgi:hypothetical protein
MFFTSNKFMGSKFLIADKVRVIRLAVYNSGIIVARQRWEQFEL